MAKVWKCDNCQGVIDHLSQLFEVTIKRADKVDGVTSDLCADCYKSVCAEQVVLSAKAAELDDKERKMDLYCG